MPGHSCPICGARSVPEFRPMCGKCWSPLPAAIGAPLVNAWRGRVINPTGFTEALITVLEWYREHPRKGRG